MPEFPPDLFDEERRGVTLQNVVEGTATSRDLIAEQAAKVQRARQEAESTVKWRPMFPAIRGTAWQAYEGEVNRRTQEILAGASDQERLEMARQQHQLQLSAQFAGFLKMVNDDVPLPMRSTVLTAWAKQNKLPPEMVKPFVDSWTWVTENAPEDAEAFLAWLPKQPFNKIQPALGDIQKFIASISSLQALKEANVPLEEKMRRAGAGVRAFEEARRGPAQAQPQPAIGTTNPAQLREQVGASPEAVGAAPAPQGAPTGGFPPFQNKMMTRLTIDEKGNPKLSFEETQPSMHVTAYADGSHLLMTPGGETRLVVPTNSGQVSIDDKLLRRIASGEVTVPWMNAKRAQEQILFNQQVEAHGEALKKQATEQAGLPFVGPKAYAQTHAETLARRANDQNVTPEDALAFKVPLSYTYGDLRRAGIIPTTPREREQYTAVIMPKQQVTDLKKYADKLLTGTGFLETKRQGITLHAEAMTNANSDARTYRDLRLSLGFVLARHVFGHGANISDLDIDRILGAIPSFWDDKVTAANKWKTLNSLNSTSMEARKRAMLGIFGREIEPTGEEGAGLPRYGGRNLSMEDLDKRDREFSTPQVLRGGKLQ